MIWVTTCNAQSLILVLFSGNFSYGTQGIIHGVRDQIGVRCVQGTYFCSPFTISLVLTYNVKSYRGINNTHFIIYIGETKILRMYENWLNSLLVLGTTKIQNLSALNFFFQSEACFAYRKSHTSGRCLVNCFISIHSPRLRYETFLSF